MPELPEPDSVLKVWVAGFCHRPGCGKPFLERMVWTPATVEAAWPRACSPRCSRAVARRRRKDRQPVKPAKPDRRRRQAGRVQVVVDLCWACWLRPRAVGWKMCEPCRDDAWRSCIAMCRGKVRRGESSAKDRAALDSIVGGRNMSAYHCPMCGWWHTGNSAGEGWRNNRLKRQRLLARMFVDGADPDELAGILVGWDTR